MFPESLQFSIRGEVNQAVEWLVVNYGDVFRLITAQVLQVLVAFEGALRMLPWWALVGAFMGLALHATRRPALALAVGAMLFLVGMLGLWDLMVQTLALMLVATLIAVAVGVPVGILVGKVDGARAILLPVLDVMQTMPSFVYLIPVLMLFGLGKVPAIIATVIYALPPLIRLTDLGLRQVDKEVTEAATAFGASPRQVLLGVEMPLALPSIMAGVNQTILLALSMVVIASMIGARGLGEEVLNGIQTLDVGKGLQAGLAIVILAVVLDRITQAYGERGRHAVDG